MRFGHREAQDMFLDVGQVLGYTARRAFSSTDPSDGVWVMSDRGGLTAGLPVAAIEVLVSESPKAISGSIHRLESISPALGIVLLHEEEVRRRLTGLGFNEARINRAIARDIAQVEDQIRQSKQRLQRWSFAQLQWTWRQVAGRHLRTVSAGNVGGQ